VVTAAEAGAAVADGWMARWVAARGVAEVRNPIGAGDALVGGLALALERGASFADAVAAGMACGAASVETDTAGVVVPARVAALLG
jgi:fructose-1-phosphate kinase PfkB-like protein